ncbi:(deoxy)nucleoside triphosphate pyrophosphohydrolase [Geoalkalibacter halelectricus]|uniref:8-oxo-dGTP diphosphatase n=1 Tax=Geoalkalibacter halelectricus TaxID=2847045 RepID=A0ABY5ZGP9_9BACT|nr:(deoxy)nucleoside triphosphate pyrophosphohydrolase [Geoalkalibacter halelectricus]MDO3380184.1 (deoxy)nucleoside triphosphate pyrophosphohydrolase [Geoalkalibacter halelectricus]UWZ78243.1 (deoxy)nucleoside triphosphate pyrophosphohydrolase [Geoalkalibacter halelectricus]
MKKKIEVACAIIEREGRVLAAQRAESMSLPLKWEFPGGKIEPLEDARDCLHRELREELGVGVHIHAALPPSDWSYADFAITLHPFVCTLGEGSIHLAEHKAIRWVSPEEMPSLDWAAADGPVLENYFRYLKQGQAGA